jgi:hypothetical protein
MSKAMLDIATSLDGFVAGKADDISRLFRYTDVDYGRATLKRYSSLCVHRFLRTEMIRIVINRTNKPMKSQ